MSYAKRILSVLMLAAGSLALIGVADVACAMSPAYRPLGPLAFLLVVAATAVASGFLPLRWRTGQGAPVRVAEFVGGASFLIISLLAAGMSLRKADSIASLTKADGNCGILVPAAAGRAFAGLGPAARYGYQVAQDVCRLARLKTGIQKPSPALCPGAEASDRSRCYQLALESTEAVTPFTLPGADLARSQGLELAKADHAASAGKADPSRQAAIELGLLEMTLKACRVHALPTGEGSTPGPFYALEPSTTMSPRSPDRVLSACGLVASSAFLPRATQAQRLAQFDRETKSGMIRAALVNASRINDWLFLERGREPQASRLGDQDPQRILYGTWITQYNEFFKWVDRELANNGKGKLRGAAVD